jgi:hypothetical protein
MFVSLGDPRQLAVLVTTLLVTILPNMPTKQFKTDLLTLLACSFAAAHLAEAAVEHPKVLGHHLPRDRLRKDEGVPKRS